MRIIELLIDDADLAFGEAGITEVALVNRPATGEGWLAFNKDKPKKQPYEVLSDSQMCELADSLIELGEDPEDLEAEGWVVVKVEKLNKQNFVGDISSDPNAKSAEDTVAIRTRYKYVGPISSNSRDFCRAMISANRVYRIEDIDNMTKSEANEEFGYYSIWQWRGSFNCKHDWVKLIYKQVDPSKGLAQNRILNDGDRTRNLEGGQYLIQESTETRVTANAKETKRNFDTTDFEMVGVDGNAPLFDNKEEALKVAEFIGCQGYHEHEVNGKTYYMPCGSHGDIEDESTATEEKQFATYEYPKYITETAQRALNYIEESGNPNGCLTPVGRRRVADLASGKLVSLDILKRMKAYGDRHKKDLEASTSLDDGCGMLAYMSWGLDLEGRAMEWLEKTITNLEEMNIDVSGLPTYTNQTGGTPTQKLTFSYDDDKMEITGAAMVPNKLIVRSSPMGEPFYVYFTEDTIKKLAFKFMKDKKMDATNIEHTTLKAEKTYVVESWLVTDESNDKSNALGLTYPKGSWVMTMKTDDPKVWKDIKEGKLTGYSVEGYFEEKLVFSKDDHILSGIKQIINNITYDK